MKPRFGAVAVLVASAVFFACGDDNSGGPGAVSTESSGTDAGMDTPGADGGPKKAPEDGLRKIYVANEDDGTVSVLSPEPPVELRRIDLSATGGEQARPLAPHNVQASPDGRAIWVTGAPGGGHEGHGEPQPDQIIVIDPLTDEVTARIGLEVGLHVAHVVFDAASRFAYVSANATNTILEIDTRTYEVPGRFELGADHGPHGLRFCKGKLYVANMTSQSLSIIDPETRAVAEVELGGVAVQTACDPLGRFVFISLYDTREVVRYEISGGGLTRLALPDGSQGPIQLYPAPDGSSLFVCDQGNLMGRPPSDRLYEIDISSLAIKAQITVGSGPHGVVVSDDGAHVFVTNIVSGDVSRVDTAAKIATALIPVGKSPNGITYWRPAGGMP